MHYMAVGHSLLNYGLLVIVKALPRVCMKNTAQGECRVVNTPQSIDTCTGHVVVTAAKRTTTS